ETLLGPGTDHAPAEPLPPLVALRAAIPADSATADDAIEALRTVVRAFAHVWFTATITHESRALQSSWWKVSRADSVERAARPQAVNGSRHAFLHCHLPPRVDSTVPRAAQRPPDPFAISQRYFQIVAGVRLNAVCPSWLLDEANPRLGDERLNADTSIAQPAVARVRAERAALIAVLDRAGARFPTNDWIVGQR